MPRMNTDGTDRRSHLRRSVWIRGVLLLARWRWPCARLPAAMRRRGYSGMRLGVPLRVGVVSLAGALLAAPALAQPYRQAVGGSVVRFFPSEEAFKAAGPSFVMEVQPKRAFPIPEKFPVSPEFGERGG